MISFYLLWCLAYLGLHFFLMRKWPKKPLKITSSGKPQKISLIIPFRNERQNVSQLASEIAKILRDTVEVILVDDQSEDGSRELLDHSLEGIHGVKILKSPGSGKKAALDFGISQAQGEIILTSDADCKFPDQWVNKMTVLFRFPGVQLVAGPVVTEDMGASFFGKFQQIEWFSILLLTRFSFSRNQPLMCSGANLAFRKKAFEEVRGYHGNEKWFSGDDEFLLKKVVARFGPESCVYLPTREVLVTTNPQAKWGDLIQQRIRWAGKWKAHRSFSHALAAVLAFLVQLVWLESIYVFSKHSNTLIFLGMIWMIKFFSEKASLGRVGESLGHNPGILQFALTSLFHPIYVIWVGLGTIFIKVKWKDRSQEDSVF
ncbi:glycosyltransferase [Algoriphagus sp. AK58]|uniref:glycosyltransferase n=1 Tax=Algoriphagus sp. AK58 TaxID=1406877 RepID=UPI00164FB17A|nr:glycosyltransferase [Algoriphagus sp. AK58]MBC6368365.1 hypothetical protein [Algoriphagus sp. AK58]